MISLESRVVSEKSKLKVKPTFYYVKFEIRIQHSQHWAELIEQRSPLLLAKNTKSMIVPLSLIQF